MGLCQSTSADAETGEAPQFDEKQWKRQSQKCLDLILGGDGFDYFKRCLREELHVYHLDFYEQVEHLKAVKKQGGAESKLKSEAKQIFENFIKSDSQNAGLPAQFGQNTDLDDEEDPIRVLEQAQEEIRKLLLIDSLPRFLHSVVCQRMKDELQHEKLSQACTKVINASPSTRAEWLKVFRVVADSIPSCVVISDYQADGLPMVFVNKAFTQVTKYKKTEAEGRNCRFLQGPETDPESIQVISESLANQKEHHVNILNYRKDGETFNNLLSLKPVFGMDGKCEYFIGVQYEVDDASMMVTRLLQHEQLLKMLPSQVYLLGKKHNVEQL